MECQTCDTFKCCGCPTPPKDGGEWSERTRLRLLRDLRRGSAVRIAPEEENSQRVRSLVDGGEVRVLDGILYFVTRRAMHEWHWDKRESLGLTPEQYLHVLQQST
jgi:hypothetical protein